MPIFGNLYDFFDVHTAEGDRVEIIESRVSMDYSNSLSPKYDVGGPLSALGSDKVKLRTDFLNQ
ncbi:MAG: hypothetical protein N4A71_03010 [Carboxylicivirga sp.]|nr:hypothetical protein [Carboxylicivirga sp.]